MADEKKPSSISYEDLTSDHKEINLDNYNEQEDLAKRAEELIQQELQRVSGISVAVPTDDKKVDLERYREEKKEFVGKDNLLQLARNGANTFTMFDKLIEELAEESASMKFDRDFNQSVLQILDNSKNSKARAQVLKLIGDMLMDKRELARNEVVNLHSKKMQAVFNYLLGQVKTALEQTVEISPELAELFWSQVQKNLHNFEENAEQIMAKVEED